MNYYEELGIRPDADEEEIRKAHRRLVKLMHPDQHRDQGMKQLAETQMRRLNSIVATLLDPEEREEYDDQLRGVSESAGHAAQQSSWRSVPLWIASTFGAIVLTVGAVWIWADRIGSSFNTRHVTVIENPPAESAPAVKRETPAPPITEPKSNTEPQNIQPAVVPAASIPAKSPESGTSNTTVARVTTPVKLNPPPPVKLPSSAAKPLELAKNTPVEKTHARPVVKDFVEEPPKIDGKKKLPDMAVATVRPQREQWDPKIQPPGNSVFTAPDPVTIPPPAPPPFITRSPLSRDPLEGEWVYAPTEPEKRKPGFYPPEFIKLRLTKQPDGMHGEYNARYNVSDSRPVSPEVSFVLRSIDKDAHKYTWTAADGRRGTFEIRSVESDTLRLEWRTTGGRTGPALTSGIATLVRKN